MADSDILNETLQEVHMTRILGMAAALLGMSTALMAAGAAAPEIDASTGVAAATLLLGGILVIRGRRKK